MPHEILSLKEKAAPRKRLPAWEDLTRPAKRVGGKFPANVERLKSRPPRLKYRIARLIVAYVLKDHAIQRFLDSSWDEVIDLMADQVAHNHELMRLGVEGNELAPVSGDALAIRRCYSQLPCTRLTAQRRVEVARSLVGHDDPILVLGDDDMLSLTLAAAGFKRVTAVDIDARVLKEIDRLARSMDLEVELVRHDLREPIPQSLRRTPFKLVFLDPIYSVEGVRLFLGSALEATAHRPGTRFFLSLHLMSLFRRGLAEIQELFDAWGLEIEDFRQGFNAYPAPTHLKGLIHVTNRLLIASKTLTTKGYAFPFFVSDATLLRKL